MILPPPFCVLRLESRAGSARFHEVLATLDRPEGRPPWATWVLDAIRRTRTDVPDGETAAWARTYWFRLEGRGGEGLPREPCPGVRLYLPGEDAPISVDPLGVHDAQYVLPAALSRFLRSIEVEGGQSVAPVATQATDPVPAPLEPAPEPESAPPRGTQAEPQTEPAPLEPVEAAAEPDPAPEAQRAEPAPARGGQPEPVAAEYPVYQGVTLTVTHDHAGWRLSFRHEGRPLLTVVEQRPPWAGGAQAQRRIVSALGDVLVGEGMPDRDHVAARLLATFAVILEELGDGRSDAGEGSGDAPTAAPDTGVVEEAVSILRHGDPVEYMLGVYAQYHEGDRGVALALALTTACQSVANASGIHVQLSGEPGSGKSHAVETWLDMLPEQYRLSGSFSDRSLFYANLTVGPLVYVDDQDLSPTMQEMIKVATTHFQEPTRHLTVTTERKSEVLTLPPRTAFIFSRVEGVGDDQVLDRCLFAWVDQSDEHQMRVTEKTLEIASLPRHLREQQRRGVDVCRAMWNEIRGRLFDVTIPFARRVRFGGLRGRSQNLVLDLTRSFAAIRFEQRAGAVDDDGTVILNATVQDFRDAVRAFTELTHGSGSQVQKLTPAERRCVDAILTWGVNEFTRGRLIDATGLSQQRVHQILHGRKDRGGGLLAKCPALNVVKMTLHGEERSISQNSYRVDPAALKLWMGYPIITLAPEGGDDDRSTRSTPDQHPINTPGLIGQLATSEPETSINRSNDNIISTCTDRSTVCETQADQPNGGVTQSPRSVSDSGSVCVRSGTTVDPTPGVDHIDPLIPREIGRTSTRTVSSRSDEGLIGGRSGVDRGLMHPLPGLIDPAEFSRAGSDHVDCAVCGRGCASRGGAFRSRDGLTTLCGQCLDREMARESRRAGVA